MDNKLTKAQLDVLVKLNDGWTLYRRRNIRKNSYLVILSAGSYFTTGYFELVRNLKPSTVTALLNGRYILHTADNPYYLSLTDKGRAVVGVPTCAPKSQYKTLREVMGAWRVRELRDTDRAYSLLDCEVIATYDGFTERNWPGHESNVVKWWRLVGDTLVGWNENMSRGWSFPVVGPQSKRNPFTKGK